MRSVRSPVQQGPEMHLRQKEGAQDERPRDAEATGGWKDREREQKSIFCE